MKKHSCLKNKMIFRIIMFGALTNIFFNSFIIGQNTRVFYEDLTYSPGIKTVLLYRDGWELSYPVVELNSEERLKLTFDELGNETDTYNYTIIHCNSDWKPSDIPETEYINGFTESQITDYEHSFNTTYDYIHYSLVLPNDDLSPKISGNYVLLVYKNFDKNEPVLTRRFYVTEQKVDIEAVVKRPNSNEYYDIGQEVNFKILHEGFPIRDPYSDIKVHLMQNYRHDNEITTLKPLFISPGVLDYTYDYGNIFKGVSEFRYFDIKSMKYQAEFIESIQFINPYYHVFLFPSEVRTFKPYFFTNDLNGKYYVDVQQARDKDIEADYVYVHFYLPLDAPVIEGDVYVFGGLTDWNTMDANKMVYNFNTHSYELTLLLKQGFYNFMYAYVPDNSPVADPGYFEGDHYETENDYSIFVYFSDVTSRYERLIGYVKTNSLSNGTD